MEKETKRIQLRDEKGTTAWKKASIRSTIIAMIFNVKTKNDNNTLMNKRSNHTRFEPTANHKASKQYCTQ